MKIDVIIYILIAVLVVAGGLMFIFSNYSKSHYTYMNDGEQFEVRKLSDTDTQVRAFVGEDETPYILTFRYDPLSLEDIPADASIKLRVSDDTKIYIAMGQNHTVDSTIAALELGKYLVLPDFYGKEVVAALTEQGSANSSDPVKNCSDASIYATVFVLKVGEGSRAYLDSDNSNCVILEGKTEEELMRVADRVAYHLVGVMP